MFEEGGRLGLKCLLLSYFRVGDIFRVGDEPPGTIPSRKMDRDGVPFINPMTEPQMHGVGLELDFGLKPL